MSTLWLLSRCDFDQDDIIFIASSREKAIAAAVDCIAEDFMRGARTFDKVSTDYNVRKACLDTYYDAKQDDDDFLITHLYVLVQRPDLQPEVDRRQREHEKNQQKIERQYELMEQYKLQCEREGLANVIN